MQYHFHSNAEHGIFSKFLNFNLLVQNEIVWYPGVTRKKTKKKAPENRRSKNKISTTTIIQKSTSR